MLSAHQQPAVPQAPPRRTPPGIRHASATVLGSPKSTPRLQSDTSDTWGHHPEHRGGDLPWESTWDIHDRRRGDLETAREIVEGGKLCGQSDEDDWM